MGIVILAISQLIGILASSSACSSVAGDCEAPFEKCGTLCIDFKKDVQNCGACGTACRDGQICSGGACAAAPEAPCGSPSEARCNSVCVNTFSDDKNCGSCNVVCMPKMSGIPGFCSGGTCR